jgi:hypothetical protein
LCGRWNRGGFHSANTAGDAGPEEGKADLVAVLLEVRG